MDSTINKKILDRFSEYVNIQLLHYWEMQMKLGTTNKLRAVKDKGPILVFFCRAVPQFRPDALSLTGEAR